MGMAILLGSSETDSGLALLHWREFTRYKIQNSTTALGRPNVRAKAIRNSREGHNHIDIRFSWCITNVCSWSYRHRVSSVALLVAWSWSWRSSSSSCIIVALQSNLYQCGCRAGGLAWLTPCNLVVGFRISPKDGSPNSRSHQGLSLRPRGAYKGKLCFGHLPGSHVLRSSQCVVTVPSPIYCTHRELAATDGLELTAKSASLVRVV